MYTYQESLMKHVMDYNIDLYKKSDMYIFILSLPYTILLFIVGFIIALFIDFIAVVLSC